MFFQSTQVVNHKGVNTIGDYTDVTLSDTSCPSAPPSAGPHCLRHLARSEQMYRVSHFELANSVSCIFYAYCAFVHFELVFRRIIHYIVQFVPSVRFPADTVDLHSCHYLTDQ